jgi:hypothetical protein
VNAAATSGAQDMTSRITSGRSTRGSMAAVRLRRSTRDGGSSTNRYERGLENQLGALGLVLNCVTLWTTVYLDAAVRQLRAQGYPVLEEDMARLSPFVSQHLGVHGTYSFVLPDLAPGAIRDLRDPNAADEDDE